jgi:Na+/H+ antiporter NhaD/arsenite permease-like protein
LVIDVILAAAAVTVTVVRPRSWAATAVVVATAAFAVLLGAGSLVASVAATGPAIGFLAVAVGLSALAVRLGLAARVAEALARRARRRPALLYVLVCLSSAAATALVSLDGAVVLLVPVVLELGRRGAAVRPLLLGMVAVANAFSLGLPEGNPTNLVVLARLDEGLGAYTLRALPAAVGAAVICAAGAAWLGRGAEWSRAAPTQVRVGAGLGAVARLGLQLSALLVVLIPVARHVPGIRSSGLGVSLGVAAVTAAVAATVNNLPASAAIAATLSGPAAYAALAGVSVGALATEHGSVATLLAGELAGVRAHERRLVPVVAAALAVATVVLYASSGT